MLRVCIQNVFSKFFLGGIKNIGFSYTCQISDNKLKPVAQFIVYNHDLYIYILSTHS